ncbi:muconate cycloisomerase [Klebsiella michiganensis]|uniref:Muconate cycloisomerase n=1 Tax=Klebsiella michiganensis TaxID=1134687 RepID=A0A7H4LVT1_9ENTR|nr:muconate cycloisomerase [Klebsiella michiganensis]
MKAQLFRGDLHYAGVTLHTAASGPVTALDTLWLRLEDRGVTGIGEVRLNIRYLHGYREEQVLNNLLQRLKRLGTGASSPRRNLPRCTRRTARCCRRRAWRWIWRCTI